MRNNEALLRHIEKRSQEIRPLMIQPDRGWIHQMREALGLTLNKLGGLCDVALPSIAQAERREATGNINVETLRKTAEAMNCDFVYAFIPKSNMEEFIQRKAYQKALRILSNADLHMSLENQKVDSDMEGRIVRLQKKLIIEGKVW